MECFDARAIRARAENTTPEELRSLLHAINDAASRFAEKICTLL
jgi:hypothetical protein